VRDSQTLGKWPRIWSDPQDQYATVAMPFEDRNEGLDVGSSLWFNVGMSTRTRKLHLIPDPNNRDRFLCGHRRSERSRGLVMQHIGTSPAATQLTRHLITCEHCRRMAGLDAPDSPA